jgi:hypothetical protein
MLTVAAFKQGCLRLHSCVRRVSVIRGFKVRGKGRDFPAIVPPPMLFGLTPHRWRFRLLRLDPAAAPFH